MSITIDKSATVAEVQKIWDAFKNLPEFKKYESSPAKIYWRSVVSQSLRGSNNFLQEFGRVRKQIVDKLISIAFTNTEKFESVFCETCVARSVGSNDPTSDYDITISGASSFHIVQEFYVIFRNIFEAEPGDVFDTNVYGGPTEFHIWNQKQFEKIPDSDVMKRIYRKLQQSADKIAIRTFAIPDGFLTTLQSKSADRETHFCGHNSNESVTQPNCVFNPTRLCSNDRCWAFLAFFRFLHGEYETFALQQLHKNVPAASKDIQNYKALEKTLADDAEAYAKLPLNKTCRVQPRPTMLRMCYTTNYYLTLIERSNNVQTAYFLALLDDKASNEQLVMLRDNLRNSIAHSNMYASEIYITNGAVLHIVVATQMKLDLPDLLRADDLFGSFLENCGFAFHVFESTEPANRFFEGPFCIAALINGSKYLGRVFDALNRRQPNKNLSVALRDILIVRSEMRGRGAESVDVEKATKMFWSIMVNSEIMKQEEKTCQKTQFLQQFLAWISLQANKFY